MKKIIIPLDPQTIPETIKQHRIKAWLSQYDFHKDWNQLSQVKMWLTETWTSMKKVNGKFEYLNLPSKLSIYQFIDIFKIIYPESTMEVHIIPKK